MLIGFGKVHQIDKFDTVYFCKHNILQFHDLSSHYTVKNPHTTVIRVNHKETCFVFTECHMNVVRIFNKYLTYLVFSKMLFKKKKEDLKIINNGNFKGSIHIGYCRGHDTLIFLNFGGYKETHKRLLLPVDFFTIRMEK